MNTENAVLMRMARESLKGKWGLAIGTFLIYLVIAGALGSIKYIGPLFSIFISPPLALGIVIFSLNISRGREARVEQLFEGFKHYGTVLAAYWLMVLYVLLWMLLLIIPGIVAALSYSMTLFILADDLSLKPKEALDKSKQMMDGYKWKMFYLTLRFFGLALLCILTLGIGFLWLIPYSYVAMAKFYDDIKQPEVAVGATETVGENI